MPESPAPSPAPMPVVPPRLAATRRGALSQLATVLLTFPRRPWVWGLPLGTALLAAFASSRMPAMYDPASSGTRRPDTPPYDGLLFSAFIFACATGFAAAAVTGHFAHLLTPPRGHVVPGMRRANVTALILLTAVLIVGSAWIWPFPSVYGPDGPLATRPHAFALAALFAAQLACTQVAPVTGVIGVFAWTALAFPASQDAILRMLVGRNPTLERFFLCAAAVLFVGLWTAIARRRDRPSQGDRLAEVFARRLRAFNPLPRTNPPRAAGTIPALAPLFGPSPRARRRLHRYAAAAGTPAVLTGIVSGLFLVLWLVAKRLFGSEIVDPATPRLLCFMVSLIPPILITAPAIENRGALLTHGLLLPLRRAHYVRGLGLAMLANLYIAWVCGLLPVLFLVPPLMPDHARPTPATLAPTLCVAAAYQLFAFGGIAWLLRLHQRTAVTFALTGLCAAGVLILADFGLARTFGAAAATATAAGIFVLAGGIAILTAAHRWVHADPPSAGPSKTAAAL